MTNEEALALSRTIYDGDPVAEELLRAKCQWEKMTRLAVLKEWGDPRTWPDYIDPLEEEESDE